MHIRRTLGVAAATAGLLGAAAGCGSSSGSSTAGGASSSAHASNAGTSNLTLGITVPDSFEFGMPSEVATQEGFFSKAGLHVKVVTFHGGSQMDQAVGTGSVDIGVAGGSDPTAATAKGLNLTAFAGWMQKSPMVIIVPASSPIQNVAQLKGQTVGITAFGSLTDYTIRKSLASVHLAPTSDVKIVPVGPPSAGAAAMAKGDISAYTVAPPVPQELVAEHKARIISHFADVVQNDQYGVLEATPGYLSSHAATVKKFLPAYFGAIQWMTQHKAQTLAIAEKYLSINAQVASSVYDQLIGMFTTDGAINVAGLKAIAAALPSLKVSTNVPKSSQYYTGRFIPVKAAS